MAMGIAFADDMPSPKNSLQCDQQLDLMLPEGHVTERNPLKWWIKQPHFSTITNQKWLKNCMFKRYSPRKWTNVP